MILSFLHSFEPQSVFRLGLLNIHWYGLLMVLAGILGFLLVLKLAQKYEIKKEIIEDIVFYSVIFGLIGARIYHIFCEPVYYFNNPSEMIKFWHGGLGIYGALISGAIVLYIFAKKLKKGGENLSFLNLADLFAPALILGQAIGRWGNWFNQELYGLPTNLPWGIPISLSNRAAGLELFQYFHPVFLYESVWDFLIFIVLIIIITRTTARKPGAIFAVYLILYSIGRFFIEFLRVNPQPMFLDLRLAQIVAILMFIFGSIILIKTSKRFNK
ncbi:MAG: prolipoprotein diacylglyceryl transferase [Patescibacteria group bacterium]|nr:prolipoprotein diacylglyceryl transferase [Patescibacteria group bacterium]